MSKQLFEELKEDLPDGMDYSEFEEEFEMFEEIFLKECDKNGKL